MKLKAKKEGRDGIYLPDKDSLKDFIRGKKIKTVHNFIPLGNMIIGADHTVESVFKDIDAAERLAVLTGGAYRNNMRHALSLITNNEMQMYDIGEIKETDLEVV